MKANSETAAADVVEVFSSFQGEGALVGVRQVFCRLQGCNLDCIYCDTPAAREEQAYCRIEKQPGTGEFANRSNPVGASELAEAVLSLDVPRGLHHSLAVTGGEPLLRAGFLRYLLPQVRVQGLRTYLETNGVLPEALEEVIDFFDYVSLDVKVPSALGGRDVFILAEQSLRSAARRKAFAKLVVTTTTTEAEVRRAAELTARVGAGIPFVLQPASPTAAAPHATPAAEQVFGFFATAKALLGDVRVIPQTHKELGLL